eukprot:2653531-Rhodomonas_salina.1
MVLLPPSTPFEPQPLTPSTAPARCFETRDGISIMLSTPERQHAFCFAADMCKAPHAASPDEEEDVELKEEMVREMEKRERVEEEMAALEQMIAEAEQEHEDELDDLRSEVDRLQYALAQKDQELFYTKTSMINGIMRQSLQGTPAPRPGSLRVLAPDGGRGVFCVVADDGAVDRVMAEMSKLEAQAVAAAGDSGKDKKGGKANKD